VQPSGSSYALVSGLVDGNQTAGADLAVQANAATTLNATASTVSGSSSLGSLWTSATGNILSTFDTTLASPSFIGPQLLAEGQLVQLPTAAATATGLLANTDYAVKLLGFGTVNATADTITMPTGITYANGNAVRFRLNSTTAPDSSDSRYGLALGTTYYVVNASGTNFQLSAAPGGSVIDLSADTIGAADQLVDADRFQLLVPPTAPGGTYSIATVTPSASGVSLTLPAVANAFAGSREADRTLTNSDTLNLAQVSGISSNTGLLSLLAGAQNAITAVASGVLNALARNTDSDATASAGLVAEGIKNTAITAGTTGVIQAAATISAVADAATVGNSSTLDNAVSNLNITARGLTASNNSNDISIASSGDVTANATLSGRSSAATVLGSSDALASLEATGYQAKNNDIDLTIGQQGNLTATAQIGSISAPLLVQALTAANGTATAQAGLTGSAILGSGVGGASFSSIDIGGGPSSTIQGTTNANLSLLSSSTGANSTASLFNTNGTGSADISGIRDIAMSSGASQAQIIGSATGATNTQALSVGGNSTATGSTTTYGILSDTGSPITLNLSQNSEISALANQKRVSSAVSVAGQASSDISNTSIGLSNVAINTGRSSQLVASAATDLLSTAQSSNGSAIA
jgi:hypothetical protein